MKRNEWIDKELAKTFKEGVKKLSFETIWINNFIWLKDSDEKVELIELIKNQIENDENKWKKFVKDSKKSIKKLENDKNVYWCKDCNKRIKSKFYSKECYDEDEGYVFYETICWYCFNKLEKSE